MTIRTFQPGDETAQVGIYNEAAADLPKFKAATLDEVRRRLRAPDCDPAARFYAIENGKPVGYCTFQRNGRISYPWCRKGHESRAASLFEHALAAMKARGMTRAFAAYRADWPTPRDFFLGHGFVQTREMLNFVLNLMDMPTPAASPSNAYSSITQEDVQFLKRQASDVFRVSAADLEKALLRNSYFGPDSLFILRNRQDDNPAAVGLLVTNTTYADPHQVDSAMPCFRLGAFGTEGLTTKRINGLFSFVVAEPRDASQLGLDLLGHAAYQLHRTEVDTFAAQVSSDVPHLVRFYKQVFCEQGSFPIFEKTL